MKKNIFFFFCMPMILFAQTHTINHHTLQMSGNTNSYDVSIHTYYNTIDSCNISWVIIEDSMPSQWDFSICFPDCYPIGVIDAQGFYLPNEQLFLNCHMYPNGQAGQGFIKMEITTNNLYKDTVTWWGDINSVTTHNTITNLDYQHNNVVKIIDILGVEHKQLNNSIILYFLNDGTVEKRIVLQ